jgi:hypothetical protein
MLSFGKGIETLQIEIGDSDRDRQNDEMRSCLSLRDYLSATSNVLTLSSGLACRIMKCIIWWRFEYKF